MNCEFRKIARLACRTHSYRGIDLGPSYQGFMLRRTDQTTQLRGMCAELAMAARGDQSRIFAKFIGLVLQEQSQLSGWLLNLDQALTMRLLEVGAFETLMVRMIGDRWGFMQSRSPNGVSMATIWDPVTRDEYEFQASTPGMALLGALASILIAHEAQSAASFSHLRGQPIS